MCGVRKVLCRFVWVWFVMVFCWCCCWNSCLVFCCLIRLYWKFFVVLCCCWLCLMNVWCWWNCCFWWSFLCVDKCGGYIVVVGMVVVFYCLFLKCLCLWLWLWLWLCLWCFIFGLCWDVRREMMYSVIFIIIYCMLMIRCVWGFLK